MDENNNENNIFTDESVTDSINETPDEIVQSSIIIEADIRTDQSEFASVNVDNTLQSPKKTKFKERFKNMISGIGSIFKDKTVTMILIILLSIVFSIWVEVDYKKEDLVDFLSKSATFLSIFAAQTLFVEELLQKKLIPRISLTVLAGGFSGVLTYFTFNTNEIVLGMEIKYFNAYLLLFIPVYLTVIVLLAIYHMYVASKLEFEKYCIDTFCALVRATVVYALFAGGIAFIIFIFNELIFDTDSFIYRIEIFLAAGIYVPSILLALSREKESYGKFSKLVMLYVLEPMIILAYLIIYLYIFKILLSGEMPSNTVFPILASVFSIAMPIWTMEMGIEEENNIFVKIAKIIPLVFIPFIILQIVCIMIRVSQYGITSLRYLALALVVFEILYMILYAVQFFAKKKLVRYSFLVVVGMLILMFWIPGTNIIDVVFASQSARIDKIGISRENTSKEKHDLYTAFSSINEVSDLEDIKLEKKYSKRDIKLLEEYHSYNWYDEEDENSDIDRTENFYSNRMLKTLDISGFSSLRKVELYEYDVAKKCDDYKDAMFTCESDSYNEEAVFLDVSDFLSDAMNAERKNVYDWLNGMELVKVGEGKYLYVTRIDLDYYNSSDEIKHVSLEGYLLEK